MSGDATSSPISAMVVPSLPMTEDTPLEDAGNKPRSSSATTTGAVEGRMMHSPSISHLQQKKRMQDELEIRRVDANTIKKSKPYQILVERFLYFALGTIGLFVPIIAHAGSETFWRGFSFFDPVNCSTTRCLRHRAQMRIAFALGLFFLMNAFVEKKWANPLKILDKRKIIPEIIALVGLVSFALWLPSVTFFRYFDAFCCWLSAKYLLLQVFIVMDFLNTLDAVWRFRIARPEAYLVDKILYAVLPYLCEIGTAVWLSYLFIELQGFACAVERFILIMSVVLFTAQTFLSLSTWATNGGFLKSAIFNIYLSHITYLSVRNATTSECNPPGTGDYQHNYVAFVIQAVAFISFTYVLSLKSWKVFKTLKDTKMFATGHKNLLAKGAEQLQNDENILQQTNVILEKQKSESMKHIISPRSGSAKNLDGTGSLRAAPSSLRRVPSGFEGVLKDDSQNVPATESNEDKKEALEGVTDIATNHTFYNEDSEKVPYKMELRGANIYFHMNAFFAVMYASMLLSNWASDLSDTQHEPLVGKEGVVMLMLMEWASVFFYLWILLMPKLYPKRFVTFGLPCHIGAVFIDMHGPHIKFKLGAQVVESQPDTAKPLKT
eukprot:TRINITY_DN3589_c0_g1_i1.p1 TRINITY_DN3589_c0_g1~~TRINITY_DN3589_c0_g1_i1.p1  ORF type:complete len:616 (+),score=145.09 TRINITY_DN3589_c0_g1_i1:28-1848(+)